MRLEAEYCAFADATDWGPPDQEMFVLYVVLLRRLGHASASQTNTRTKRTASAIRVINYFSI